MPNGNEANAGAATQPPHNQSIVGPIQIIGPYLTPVKVTWEVEFAGKASLGPNSSASVAVEASIGPGNPHVIWSASDKDFTTYDLSSTGVPKDRKTVFLSALNTLILTCKTANNSASATVDRFTVNF
jgi:hypothetical protein